MEVIGAHGFVKTYVLCVEDGTTLFIRSRGEEDWHIPGGPIEGGETPEQAAERELVKTTGYRPNPGRLVFIAHIGGTYHFWVDRLLVHGDGVPHEHEKIEVCWKYGGSP